LLTEADWLIKAFFPADVSTCIFSHSSSTIFPWFVSMAIGQSTATTEREQISGWSARAVQTWRSRLASRGLGSEGEERMVDKVKVALRRGRRIWQEIVWREEEDEKREEGIEGVEGAERRLARMRAWS
jgi:hypothetical protein